MFEHAKKIVESLEKRIDDMGLIPCYEGNMYWNFYEWRHGLAGAENFEKNAPYESPLNTVISDAFWCFARLCDVVQPELADHYDMLHKNLNHAIHQTFFDAERKVYITRLHEESDIGFWRCR